MSQTFYNLTSHLLEPGDTICMIDKTGFYDWDQCILVIDQVFKDGWVSGYGSFLNFDEKEVLAPEYNELKVDDHDYQDAPVYMVVTHDQRIISAPEGSSICCVVNKDKVKNDDI